ncbi:hypothetical protein GBAR_LOCUS14671 [Geodia barretti]|uniref:Uncharacterized protein n=1 Tax=Geodia barretti TaxID=519541 RepID=A0AA35S8G0_GEOBA|nr:hypothetical protein GBAR_LOCUS14671 [Geodia barretti]
MLGFTAKVTTMVSSSGFDATRTTPSPTESPSPGFTSTMATALSLSVYTTGPDTTRTTPSPTESPSPGTVTTMVSSTVRSDISMKIPVSVTPTYFLDQDSVTIIITYNYCVEL